MVAQHFICVTIDTDPDGLSTHHPDRKTLIWEGLHFAMSAFHETFPQIPLTWYVRADGQIEQAYGSITYLFERHADFWHTSLARGDELGWHPHLYTVEEEPQIIRDSDEAVRELKRLWQHVQQLSVPLPTFRMGEGWHTRKTLDLIERFGFLADSTAIPGRDDSSTGHPRNWNGTPNQPYFPSKSDLRLAGEPRPLLEVPMNSWRFQASYDREPRLRYMNPCIHSELWEKALDWWEANLSAANRYLWNLILHPIEAMPQQKADLLYANSLESVQQNLDAFVERITKRGDSASFTTIGSAAKIWNK